MTVVPREERRVDLRVVKTRHRPAIQPERTGRQNEIAALQLPIPQREVLQHILGQILEPRLGVHMREQFGQFLVEMDVHGDTEKRHDRESDPACHWLTSNKNVTLQSFV